MNWLIQHWIHAVLLIQITMFSNADDKTRTYILKTGKMILNDGINVQENIHIGAANTLMECVRMCSQPDCKAVNYNEAERACEIKEFDEYYKMSRTVDEDENWKHAVKNECPGEFINGFYPGSCYFRNATRKMNWTSAREHCQAMGSELAVLDSMDELNTLRRQHHNYTGRYVYWVGATDAVEEGSWRWIGINITLSDDFPAWTNGSREASDTNKTDCLVVGIEAYEVRIKAADCAYEKELLCELPLY
ncbi:unnamed protein product [Owenia fusiformis]|uniref:C-type lectin domain-containing protein n=1 Tax=Owenia fusiformis TaxID=6347 RepID=A0A8S4PVV7_OWEFU|nr:unnamed protein product [Owenia fusiformis]